MKEVRIRKVEVTDTKAILDIYKEYILHDCATFEYDVPSFEEFQNRIETIIKKYPYIVYEEDGVLLGYAYASTFKERAAYQWDVEVSIYLHSQACGKGIGKALYEKLLYILKEQGILHVYSCITLPNPASIALHEHFGFTKVGIFRQAGYKFNKWLDIIWLERTMQELSENPRRILLPEELKIDEICKEKEKVFL